MVEVKQTFIEDTVHPPGGFFGQTQTLASEMEFEFQVRVWEN
jgi:hypothetical protein